MHRYTTWITLTRDGLPRAHDFWADSLESARQIAEDLARCIFPRQSLTLTVWGAM